MDYDKFLDGKRASVPASGFDPGSDVSDVLFPHQRDIVRWCVLGGKRAIFAAFGLGKSLMQLEIMRLVLARDGGRALIVCPLGVRQEFKRDAQLLGLELLFVRRTDEVGGSGLYLTNYESVRDGRLDVSLFDAVSLDEASVLRSFGSKTYQTFLALFDSVPYRFVATATPSPNRYKELIHYAGFLGIMDTGQALTRFFQRDSTKANNLTLYPHKEREFWLWVSSWAAFVQRPSDLGYSDDGYELPPMEVVWHEIPADDGRDLQVDRDGQALMFHDATLSLSAASREKRATMSARVAKAREIVDASPDDHFILWHDLEDERREIKHQIPDAVEVFGSQDIEERERRIVGFSDGEFRLLATKPVLSGSGCNFQRHCHREIFVGVGFKFNDFIQSIHRVQRFQQTGRVRIDIIYAESEREVVKLLREKWARHDELSERMAEIIKEHGLSDVTIANAMCRSIGVDRIEASGEGWCAVNNDTVIETSIMDGDSVDLIVTSIPFSNHYEYTPSYNDFGHTDDDGHFFDQMDFLTPELYRVLKPGRIYACHTKDRINFGNVTGAGVPTVQPFHAEVIAHGLKHGFDYMGMITVITDVVRENNQTYRLGWSEQCKDGTKMGVGSPEYILIFHKPQSDRSRGYADVPVVKSKDDYTRARWQVDAHAFWRSSGMRSATPEELSALPVGEVGKAFKALTRDSVYDYESHVRIGEELDGTGHLPSSFMALAPASWHPEVWDDVNRMLTLNTEQSRKRQQMHVCPLQFDIVDRLITRYSNPGDLVYDPFGGLMTVPLRAVMAGRRGRGTELNPQYFLDGVKYLQAEERKRAMPTIFDFFKEDRDDLHD
ncbi:DNA methyltransferase [Gordonibacter sp.]|uniref:DNA methyltransferase n=1 Tax=Gordonibacter sp. TaxID=1968902 RepID=UPI002FC5A3F8